MSHRQILVGERPAAIMGLDEMFDELYEQGRRPDEPDLGAVLVAQARERRNYIPKRTEGDFAQALLREYRKYVAQRQTGQKPRPVDYGTWQGHPREHIPWFPTLAEDLCDGCGACLRFCSYGVFAATDDGKVIVAEPFKCQVGCSACVHACPLNAITFPPRAILDAFRPGR